MSEVAWISLGAVAGANARFAVGKIVAAWLDTRFPFGTLLVNVSGSLLIGVLLTVLTDRLDLDPRWRLLLVVGFLGSYTTMSTYAWELLDLARNGSWFQAGAYLVATNALCLGACAAGIALAQSLR